MSTQPQALSKTTPQVAGPVATLSNVKTGDIQVGDVVLNYGMPIRIDEIVRHEDPTTYEGQFWTCFGTVLNVQEAIEVHDIPRFFMFDNERDLHGPGHGREDFWNVQGNNLATWTVERGEA